MTTPDPSQPEQPDLDPDVELRSEAPELVGLLESSRQSASEGDVAALRAAVLGDLERERGPLAWLRSRQSSVRLGLAALGVVLLAVSQLLFSRRVDFEVFPAESMLFALALFGVSLGAAVSLALRPLGLEPVARVWAWLAIGIALVLPVALYSGPPVHELHAESLAGAGEDLARRALKCFLYGLALVVPLLLLYRGLDRRSHRSPGVLLLFAAAGGTAANLLLYLHCPITHASHLLLGHATTVLALLGGYAALAWLRRS